MRLLIATVCVLVLGVGCGEVTDPPETASRSVAPDAWVTWTDGMRELPDDGRYERADQHWIGVATDLVEYHEDEVAVMYVDEDARVVLVAGSDRGQQRAEKALADAGEATVVARGPFTRQEIDQLSELLRKELPEFAETWRIWGANTTGTGLQVHVAEDPDEAGREAVEGFAESHGFRIEVYVVPGMPKGSLF